MAPVPARLTGTFRQWPVTTASLCAFSSIWTHRLPENDASPIVVAADATIDLQWIDHAFRVAGPDSEAAIEHFPAGTLIIGFRFHPAAAATWLETAASEIANQRPDLEALWGARARRAAVGVATGENISGLIRSLRTVIGRMAPDFDSADPEMRAAYQLIAAGAPPGAPLVPWLSRALGMSERTLRRRSDDAFGYGPKTLDRILRYQRYRRIAKNSSETTAILALDSGYADQAHLVRESRRLAGCAPGALNRLAASRAKCTSDIEDTQS